MRAYYSTLSDNRDAVSPARVVDGGVVRSLTITPAAGDVEPVTAAELCTYARAPITQGHELLVIAKSVRANIEGYLEIAIVEQTITAIFEGPAIDLRLPRTPLRSITSIKESDQGTLGSDIKDEYYVDGDRLRRTNAHAVRQGVTLEVIYVAGLTTVADDIQLAIKQLTNDAYCARGATTYGKQASQVANAGLDLLNHYKR